MEPNILITNNCNQNCAFCFAKEEMGRPFRSRFMGLDRFKSLASKLKSTSSLKSIKILGGEPTLHPDFEKIISLSLNKYNSVQLFTNGVFPSRTTEFLKTVGTRVDIIFNISTPGFQTNEKIRNMILSNISELSKHNHIILSITYGNGQTNMLEKVPKNVIEKAHSIRLGISNPQAKFSLALYRRLGKITLEYIKKIHTINKEKIILLNCGYTPCMFTKKQISGLLTNHLVHAAQWSCFGKDGSYDIGIDGKAFSCFVHSKDKEAVNLDTDKRLFLSKYLKRQKNIPQSCKKCSFFMKECSGPCIA